MYVQDTVYWYQTWVTTTKTINSLPFGNYTVGAHHLYYVLTLDNDQHGLRHKDLSDTHKQNFDAVNRWTSDTNIQLQLKVADALRTKFYLKQ